MTKIILVEDDPMISEIYERKFSESGFEVLTAASGEQVLTLAKKDKIDAILLDLILPKMDGFEVMKSLRSGGYDPGIKIIVFSNLNQREDQDKAIELGASGFITKSEYTPSNLVKEVNRLLNQFHELEKNGRRERMNLEKGNGAGNFSAEPKGKKILLIEDEEIFLELFGHKLTQDGYEVNSASDSMEGLQEALKGGYDLYIIDLIMPNISGDEIVAKLKAGDKSKDLPIIVLSAMEDTQLRKKVEDMGVNAFLVKTQIVPSDLSRKVGDILNI